MAPVYLELKKRNVNTLLLHTGQHSEIADMLYELFGMQPDYRINLRRNIKIDENGPKASDLASLGGKLLIECSKILSEVNPYAVMVHGDTSSALMMALAAYYHQCKIVHIEAGLRTGNLYSPWPEEANRTLTGVLTKKHHFGLQSIKTIIII